MIVCVHIYIYSLCEFACFKNTLIIYIKKNIRGLTLNKFCQSLVHIHTHVHRDEYRLSYYQVDRFQIYFCSVMQYFLVTWRWQLLREIE